MISSQTMYLLFGSIGLGLVLGGSYILVLRFGRMRNSPALQILFCILSSFFTYSLAEISGLSGIIATLFCAMLMSAYAPPHLTTEGRLLTSFLLKQLASLGDMAVFLFVGITIVFVNANGVRLGLCMMLFCLVGRFFATFPLGFVSNLIKMVVDRDVPCEDRTTLSLRHMFMMWHAGLRGGIALVLTLQLGHWVPWQQREQLRNATLIVIIAFLLIFGGSTHYFLKLLRIPMGSERKEMKHKNGRLRTSVLWTEQTLIEPLLVGSQSVERQLQHGGIVAVVQDHLDQDRAGLSSVDYRGLIRWHSEAYDLYGTTSPEGADRPDVGNESPKMLPWGGA
jgi:NhaP-type Na+/H+ or K+/H+ antiporter